MELVEAFRSCDWKGFERLIAQVLELHNFEAYWNTTLTISGFKRQFDVIANKNDCSLVIDCKKWNSKKGQVNALIKSADKHLERCSFLNKILGRKEVIPVIITYNEEPIVQYKDVFVVPLHRLNDFILGLL